MKSQNKITLSESIKRNPYLNIKNCTDLSDINAGLDFIADLKRQFGERISLLKLYNKFLDKKIKLQESPKKKMLQDWVNKTMK
jgi:hypothetical protein